MTPLAEKLFKAPLTRDQRALVGDLLSGCQFYDVSALGKVIDIRSNLPFSDKYLLELTAGHVPANRCWFQFSAEVAIGLEYLAGRRAAYAPPFCRYVGVGVSILQQQVALVGFAISEPKANRLEVDVLPWHAGEGRQREMSAWAANAVRSAWFCIEAMQTPGFTHTIPGRVSRQQERQRQRRSEPVHKWVTVRLGRPRPAAGGGGTSRRTVAWHYRNGHRINHPNPNFPKWRKGCWVGNPANGIRSHDYVIEVPD